MVDTTAKAALESGARPIICTVCEALPATERKRLRDAVMTRQLRQERERAEPASEAGRARD
jgi:hypothetical protein